jgi:hypothetical protein
MQRVSFVLAEDLKAWASSYPTAAKLSEAINTAIRQSTSSMETPFDKAIDAFKKNLASMHPAFEFEVPQVVGDACWTVLDRSSRHAFGRHIKANQSAFGVEFVRTTSSNHAVYRRKSV